jgi:hypothetical protein
VSETESSQALENKEHFNPNADAAETGNIPSSPIATKQLFREAMMWSVDEDVPTSFPDIDWDCAEPTTTTTTTTTAEGAGLSISFPDFAAFLRGMEKNTSVNLADALNTSGSSSSFFAHPEDEIIVPEKLIEEDVSKQQQDKSAVEFSEEGKAADVSKQQDKSLVDSNKGGKPAEESIEEENRADDSNTEGKSTNVPSNKDKPAEESIEEENRADDSNKEGKPTDVSVQEDKPADGSILEDKSANDSSKGDKPEVDSTEEEKPNIDANKEGKLVVGMNTLDALDQLVAMVSEMAFDPTTPEKPKQTLVETPDFKRQAKSKNVPNLTPVSEAETNSYSESDEEGMEGRDLQSSHISFREESFSSKSGIRESDALRELHSHYYKSTDAVNEDDLMDEAYNSMDVSVLSLAEIFQDVLSDISALTTEEVGPIYSLGTSFESTVAKASSELNRSMFGDWVAEVMSIEVSLEAGKFTLRKMDGPGEDTAQQGHFMTRTEYLPRLTLQDEPAFVEGPQDELEADKEAGDYFVKAQWNEFLPESIFTNNCQQGADFSLTDFCNGKEWKIRC